MATDKQPSHSTADSIVDPNNEFYLHHSDHRNCSLASRVLDGDNYGHWRRAVEVSLLAISLSFGMTQQPVILIKRGSIRGKQKGIQVQAAQIRDLRPFADTARNKGA
ncbi:hypothetical protein Droror1_Dr00019122 [Drosera rotundifolia]